MRRYLVTAAFSLLIVGVVLFGISIYSASAPAVEHVRLAADFNGDDVSESIVLSTSGTGDFRRYSIRVGAANYDGEFFAVSGDLPKIKLIQIDSSKKQKQILVTTPSPVDCGYVVLSFDHEKLFRLLEHSSKNCDEPRVRGNELEIFIWEGFWNRRDRYTLDQRGTELNLVDQAIYPVELAIDTTSVTEIAGVARGPLTLKPADCKDAAIPKGGRVVVKSYDRLKKRYLLKAAGGRCGWIAESDLQTVVDGLPWAG